MRTIKDSNVPDDRILDTNLAYHDIEKVLVASKRGATYSDGIIDIQIIIRRFIASETAKEGEKAFNEGYNEAKGEYKGLSFQEIQTKEKERCAGIVEAWSGEKQLGFTDLLIDLAARIRSNPN